MSRVGSVSLVLLFIVVIGVTACDRVGHSQDVPAGPALIRQATADGLTMTVQLEQLEVPAGASVTARVVLQNRRPVPVQFGGGCEAVSWIVMLEQPTEPSGRVWAGIAGELKHFVLTTAVAPGGQPALKPLEASPRHEGCRMQFGAAELPAGESRSWSVTWPAVIVDGVPALPGNAPFVFSIGYDPDDSSTFITFKQLSLTGDLTITGPAPRVLSAGEALDVLLADERFVAWLEEQPPATWRSASLALQAPRGSGGSAPAGPAWEIALHRDKGGRRYWRAFVNPLTGELTSSMLDQPP